MDQGRKNNKSCEVPNFEDPYIFNTCGNHGSSMSDGTVNIGGGKHHHHKGGGHTSSGLPIAKNEVDMFFLSMAQIVKRFPETELARIRMEVCQLVTGCELQILSLQQQQQCGGGGGNYNYHEQYAQMGQR